MHGFEGKEEAGCRLQEWAGWRELSGRAVPWILCSVGPCPAGGSLLDAQLASPTSILSLPSQNQGRSPHFSMTLTGVWDFHWWRGALRLVGFEPQDLLAADRGRGTYRWPL